MTELPPDTPLDAWAARLEQVIVPLEHLHRVFVVATTSSTQDAAARMQAGPGDVVVAGRQTAGRGRRGRAWADTGEAGVAVTIVLPAAPPPRLAIAMAIGAAGGAEQALGGPVGIKWPNDLVVGGRKLGGILIEQSDGLARVGIGVNVRQASWPADLATRAASLALLGGCADRLVVLEALLPAIDGALGVSDASLAAAWAARDALRGQSATFERNGERIRGRVVRVDPSRGLAVQTAAGEVWLDGATTVRADEAALAPPAE